MGSHDVRRPEPRHGSSMTITDHDQRSSAAGARGPSMPRLAHPLAVVLTAFLLVLLSGGPALATNSDRGRITFMRQDSSGFWQVWVADADMTRQRQLTHQRANSGWPVWSPDGRRIAFDSDRDDPDPDDSLAINDIFTMRPDGTRVTKLTGSVNFNADAGWSPDGSSIVFNSDRANPAGRQSIFVMKADGTRVRRVTRLPSNVANDVAARFSPDGRTLVFTRFRGGAEFGDSALYTIGLGGGRPTQLTPFGVGAGDATWSPDGRWIAFEAYPTAHSTGQVRLVRRDGSGMRTLTRRSSADPVWSPDGRRLLFLHGETRNGALVLGLATMRPDGSGLRFVSRRPMGEHQPDWAPPRY